MHDGVAVRVGRLVEIVVAVDRVREDRPVGVLILELNAQCGTSSSAVPAGEPCRRKSMPSTVSSSTLNPAFVT